LIYDELYRPSFVPVLMKDIWPLVYIGFYIWGNLQSPNQVADQVVDWVQVEHRLKYFEISAY
jgi:superoxide dismutase